MTKIFGIWHRCDWCGRVSLLALGWTKNLNFKAKIGIDNLEQEFCSGMCAEKKRTGFDIRRAREKLNL